jgi:hypothetical protein
MNLLPTLIRLFYLLKPAIPRWLQVFVRRRVVAVKRPFYHSVWPVDEQAGTPPPGWKGWPMGKRFAMVITHDVEGVKGFSRCGDLMDLDRDGGFVSSFNFIPDKSYTLTPEVRTRLTANGFEVGVHDWQHNGKLLSSKAYFDKGAPHINARLREWNAVGFRAGAMHRNLAWFHDLNIEYDSSTFDTDPFEPHPQGLKTIFPAIIRKPGSAGYYVELPYTLPQDFNLFIIMRQKGIDLWKRKLDWIAEKGGMALVIVHPDYINFTGGRDGPEEYPVRHYTDLLKYIQARYRGQFWNVLPRSVAAFFRN